MLITLLKTFLLPPALQLLLIVIAVLLWRRKKWMSWILMVVAWGSLWLFSLPVVSVSLFNWLEQPYLVPSTASDAQAIVVLGGGRESNAPEYGGRDQVSSQSLRRLRYGAHLAKKYSLPIIVSGGSVYPYEEDSEALLAAELLRQDYGLTNIWQEGKSRNTWENAKNTAALLEQKGIQKAFLVTSAYHMRRSEFSFRGAGVEVIPRATGFASTRNTSWWDAWIPKAKALQSSRVALHEYLGLFFYEIKAALHKSAEE